MQLGSSPCQVTYASPQGDVSIPYVGRHGFPTRWELVQCVVAGSVRQQGPLLQNFRERFEMLYACVGSRTLRADRWTNECIVPPTADRKLWVRSAPGLLSLQLLWISQQELFMRKATGFHEDGHVYDCHDSLSPHPTCPHHVYSRVANGWEL